MEREAETDSNGAPVIRGLSRKIRCLERRKDALDTRIQAGTGSNKSLDYDRAESDSIVAALDALRYHWAIVQRMDTPLTALGALVETVEKGDKPGIAESMARGREVLEEFEA